MSITLPKSKYTTSTALTSSKPAITLEKAIRLEKDDVFINPCWLLLITILSLCLEAASRISCSTCRSSHPPSCPSWRQGWHLFLTVLRDLPWSPWPLEDYWEQSPSHSSHNSSSVSVLDSLVVGSSFLRLQQQHRKKILIFNFSQINVYTGAPME